MKKLLLIVLLLASQNVYAWGNWYGKYDKALHFASAAAITVVSYKACRGFTELSKPVCTIASGLATFAVTGPLKEATDINWDNEDVMASGAGSVFGVGLTILF